ncbi:MAG: hypothetical protein QM804_08770 [Propionicimonas sp.]
MEHWPFWGAIAGAVLLGMMLLAGWFEIVMAVTIVLLVGPMAYVLVVILFFDDTRRR